MEIIIMSLVSVITVLVTKIIKLNNHIEELERENDHLLDSSTILFYDNKKMEEELVLLKNKQHELNKKVSEYEAKIKKITEFFGK